MATTQTPNPTTPRATNAKPQATGSPPSKATAKAVSPTTTIPNAIAPDEAAREATLGQRLMRTLRGSKVNTSAANGRGPAASNANGANETTGRRGALGTQPGYWRKFFQGSLIFVGGSYIIILGLTYLSLNYPALGLNSYIQPPKANVLILSGLTWENLIFFVVIIGLWLLVQRLGLMPRPEPMTPNSARGASGTAGASGGSKSSAKGADSLPGIGEHRTRAERRRLAAIAAEKEAQKAAARAKTKGGAKATATPAAGPTKVGANKAAASTVATPVGVASDHDEVYERVKADQRLRRRRDARR